MPPAKLKSVPVPTKKVLAPRMAIILDDWGNNGALLKLALDIKRPLTLAILPNLPHSKRIAEEAFKNGLGVMIHMPMQPRDPKERLEPHTILTTSADDQIRRYLEEAVESVPHAEGMNNHMGSRATCDERVMRVFLTTLKSKGFFFVDSNVVKETKGWRIAQELDIPYAKREVFIDNELNLEAVKKQLLKAKKKALSNGSVVVIGHDKKVTLQAIQETLPELEKAGIEFVLVKELLQN